jgi:hypothetical protein
MRDLGQAFRGDGIATVDAVRATGTNLGAVAKRGNRQFGPSLSVILSKVQLVGKAFHSKLPLPRLSDQWSQTVVTTA